MKKGLKYLFHKLHHLSRAFKNWSNKMPGLTAYFPFIFKVEKICVQCIHKKMECHFLTNIVRTNFYNEKYAYITFKTWYICFFFNFCIRNSSQTSIIHHLNENYDNLQKI